MQEKGTVAGLAEGKGWKREWSGCLCLFVRCGWIEQMFCQEEPKTENGLGWTVFECAKERKRGGWTASHGVGSLGKEENHVGSAMEALI